MNIKRIANSLFLVLFTMFTSLFASETGIVVACSEKYAQDLYASLKIIREIHLCDLPIEIWHAGEEMCQKTMDKLLSIEGVSLHDIVDVYGGDPKSYRGYHIKGFSLHASNFNECFLMDADAIFFQSPQILLDHPTMKENAAYFFRDRQDFKFNSYNASKLVYHDRYFHSEFTYKERKEILLHLIPTCTESIPPDWRHYWERDKDDFIVPTPSEHQDSGCVAIVKERCPKGIELIKVLNEFHDLFYQYILGDKETYWMALAASNESFVVNPVHPYILVSEKEIREMLHFLDDKLFFMQKKPIDLRQGEIKLVPSGNLALERKLTKEEISYLNMIYLAFKQYILQFREGK